jgi:hypothetical protein
VKASRPSVRCSECPEQCFCGSSKTMQRNHLGGWKQVPWLFLPFCGSDHAQFHVMCRRAGVDFSYTGDRPLVLIQALKAMLVGLWMVVDMLETHLKDQLEAGIKNETNT